MAQHVLASQLNVFRRGSICKILNQKQRLITTQCVEQPRLHGPGKYIAACFHFVYYKLPDSLSSPNFRVQCLYIQRLEQFPPLDWQSSVRTFCTANIAGQIVEVGNRNTINILQLQFTEVVNINVYLFSTYNIQQYCWTNSGSRKQKQYRYSLLNIHSLLCQTNIGSGQPKTYKYSLDYFAENH